MARSAKISFKFVSVVESLQSQFRDLDPKDPSLWPVLPRILLCGAIAIASLGIAWYVRLSDYQAQLDAEQSKEFSLKEDFQKKVVKAVRVDALKNQREQVQNYVIQLEKQLPSKAEMAALLSDINQAGLGRGLQFELFRPGQVVVKDYYAELPISVRVTGKFHDIGAFASDVAHLSRIVTLNGISVTPLSKDSGMLTLDTTARTYRYLDQEEIETQKKAGAQK